MKTLVCLVLCVLALPAVAAVRTQTVEYKDGDLTLEGYLAYDDAVSGKRPGVLVVHEWKGLNGYAKSRCEQLAQLGYIAFAADIYGKGVRPATIEEASAQAGKFYQDRQLMRARAKAGLEYLKGHEFADGGKVAAIGYCFGGSVVLELARSGADLAGVVSFHGGLESPTPEDAKNIKAKVLVCHGADDPMVSAEAVAGFEKEMRQSGADWQLIAFGGAVHGFTNPNNGSDNSKGVAYNEKADQRSWAYMLDFFNEIFGQKK